MSSNTGRLVWGGFIFLWSSLTIVLVIGLWLRWRFKSRPAIEERQKYAQPLLLILCYLVGVGGGVCALLFHQDDKGEAPFHSYSKIVLCINFCHYATMNVYFYQVWQFYYKCKLQNEFEKVTRNPNALTGSTILKHIMKLSSNASFKIEEPSKNEQRERLIKWSKLESARKSWFVRYRRILGRSMLDKVFWLLLWISECIVVSWTFRSRTSNKNISWSSNEIADEFFNLFAQVMCLFVLFLFPNDDLFLIKVELRLIFLISTVELALYYILLYREGTPGAYLTLAIGDLLIMVTITCSTYWAITSVCSCCVCPIFKRERPSHKCGSSSDTLLTMMDVLENEGLFQAFERHLKREFSLENLNFIVAVVHYRRLCDERSHNMPHNNSKRIHGRNKSREVKEISMQPYRISRNAHSGDTSIMVSAGTPVSLISGRGVDSELRKSPASYFSPCDRSKMSENVSKQNPRLNWIKSNIEVSADKQDNAVFIFDEYCDRGAPQEINISRGARDELVEFFSRPVIRPDELNTIFNRAFDSIMDLLANDSFRRFRRHSSFHKFTK